MWCAPVFGQALSPECTRPLICQCLSLLRDLSPAVILSQFKLWHNAWPTIYRCHGPPRPCIFGCKCSPSAPNEGQDRLTHYLICPALLLPIYARLHLPPYISWKRTANLDPLYRTVGNFNVAHVALDVDQRSRHLNAVDPIPLIKDSIRRIDM